MMSSRARRARPTVPFERGRSMERKGLAGRLVLSFVAVFTAVSPYAADWNETHIYNPNWPPHAKFHNAQTMLFGAAVGLLSLVYLWTPRWARTHVGVGAVFAAIYWVTQMFSLTFPGTALRDPTPAGLDMP